MVAAAHRRLRRDKRGESRSVIEKKAATTVVSNKRILGRAQVVKGRRAPADNVLAEVRDGRDKFEIFSTYPSLPVDGVATCLARQKSGRSL